MASRLKRDQKRKDTLRNWFCDVDGNARSRALSLGDPGFILKLLHLFSGNRMEMEELLKFARRYKQTVSELTADDLREVQDLIVVKAVLES